MSHPPLRVLGYSEAAMFLRGPQSRVLAIISIHGKREFGVEAVSDHRLDLIFDDVDVPISGDKDSMLRYFSRRRQNERDGLIEVAPTRSDAAAIIEFAEKIKAGDGTVLCHCGGGMSRAPAAALICLAVWRGGGDEEECVQEVLKLRIGAVPHIGLVQFADELLGREGKLAAAVIAGRR